LDTIQLPYSLDVVLCAFYNNTCIGSKNDAWVYINLINSLDLSSFYFVYKK
jgi:hypothetical protein